MKRVSEHKAKNQMDFSNLLIVFAPSLLEAPPGDDPLEEMKANPSILKTIFEELLT